jgi:cyclopropane-fatty-acyl-phospholipid synthase
MAASGVEAVIFGGSPSAIRHHYDVGNAFYRLWLDESLTYSSALWSGVEGESLAAAQRAKLDWHLDNLLLPEHGRLLDIGCGWGALLERAAARGVLSRSVGLTLSEEQAAHVAASSGPTVSVRLETWAAHEASEPYDGIVSIGAFEHFADPRQSPAERLEVYRSFFEACRRWLTPKGVLSLQTIVYGDMAASEASEFIANEIFPAAELPRPQEIFSAADRIFEIVAYRNDRLDYARTCEAWLGNLRRRRREAIDLVGPETVQRYERYLMLSAMGFRLGRIGLARLKLIPVRAARRIST